MSDESQQPKSPSPKEKSLSEGEIFAVTEHINRIVGGPEKDICPVCGSFDNQVEPYVFQIPVAYEPALLGIARHAPSYITNCRNCGFTRFFNKNLVDALVEKASDEGNS